MGPELEYSRFFENCSHAGDSDLVLPPLESVTPVMTTSDEETSPKVPLQEGTTPLYESAQRSKLNVHDCMVSLLTFAHSAHLSGKSTVELLEFLEMVLPQPNNLPKTSYMFKKYFRHDDNEIQMYFFCSKCYKSRESQNDICNECKGRRTVSYFVTTSLSAQLQKLYSRPGFKDKLQYKSIRVKKNLDNIEDVYDSSVYKEAETGVLGASANNISLTFYTDGIAIYEVSSYSLWPCMFTINELPPNDRHKIENVLIGGLWGGDSKPHPNILLLPQYQEIKKLNNGIPIRVHGSAEEITVQAILLFFTSDSPARASFMNMKSHSGYFSCPKCFIEGEKSQRTGNVLVFPHHDNLVLRNDENYQDCVQQGLLSKDGHKGVFGPTILSYMFSESFISGVTIDVMHSCYMGLTKQLIRLWFDVKYKDEAFSLVEKIPQVNERLEGFNLPHFVQRLLLDVDKNLSFWKASLCRNFLLYVVLVLLQGIQGEAYFRNLCKLVEGISLLNSDSISNADLERADHLLVDFCKEFEVLYGLRHMSFNLHLLRHLKQCVIQCGNLWVYICFDLEDLNGQLAALVHGTRHAIKQIISKLDLLTDLPLLIKTVQSDIARTFCEKLICKSKNFKRGPRICSSTYVVGEFSDASPHYQSVTEYLNVLYKEPVAVSFFDRLYKTGQLYVAACYKRGSRISCYCRYEINREVFHGRVLTFVRTNQDKYFVLLEKSYDSPTDLPRYVEFISSGNIDLIPVKQLVSVSFFLDAKHKMYLIDPLNPFEME